MVQQTLARHRLSLHALASRLEVTVDDLGSQTLGNALVKQVEALNHEQPEPLVAVYDVLSAEREEWGRALLEDARQLANKILSLSVRHAYMEELHETHLTALNHLRLYVYGEAKDKGHDYIVPQKVWQVARPVEALLESWVKANNLVAQQRIFGKLQGAHKELEFLREERLTSFEESFGRQAAVRAVLKDFDQKYEELVNTLEAYYDRYEALMETVPLSFGGQGQDLSLTAQMPREARAQAMAEEALASLKASKKTERRNLRQQGKAREQEVMENLFHSLLATLEANQEPDMPPITTVDLDLNKATGNTPKASPAASLKEIVNVAVPKAPRVKRVKVEEAKAKTPEQAGPATPPTKKSIAEAPAPQLSIASPADKPKRVAKPTEAPQEKEAELYKDTGHREPGWQKADEKMLAFYSKKNKGYFSSKAAFGTLQRNIMGINRARAMGFKADDLKRLIKSLNWGSDGEPPLPT